MSWFFKEAKHSQLYLRYRPTYPSEVFKMILAQLDITKLGGRWKLALDLGCGTGQSTLPLCDHFEEVIGIDPSEAQLNEAKKSASDKSKRNVNYITGKAHDLSFVQNDSADLIAAAQSAHWFQLDKFYHESLRALRPGGTVALYGYGLPRIIKPEGHHILMELYKEKLGPYWEKGREHIDNLYSDIYETLCRAFPICSRDDTLEIRRTYTVDEFIGYLTTWSAYQHYRQENPHVEDPMEDVRSRLLSVFIEDPMKVSYPVFILFGKKA